MTGIVVTDSIVTTSPADTYPTHDALYGKGGQRTVADTTARDAIPALRRAEGMLVYCQSNGTTYILASDLVTWSAFTTGGSGGQSVHLNEEGLDGDMGPPGPQGPSGASGSPGAQGPAGPAVYLEADAQDGEQGPPGQAGPAGAAGAQGPMGPAVYLEVEGQDGDTGPPGPTGAQGPTGSQGGIGPAVYLEADQGEQGDMGPQGNQGPQGASGSTGAQGPQGAATYLEADYQEADFFAIPGAPGAAGNPGSTGAQGTPALPIAVDGMDGDDGQPIPGPVGPTGPTGSQGGMGPAVYLDADQGDPGDIGPPGPVGAQGSAGTPGAQGPMGPAVFLEADQGDQGDLGPQGVQGMQGVQGTQGAPGASGPAVYLEAQEADEQMVVPGPTGAAGAQGTSGAQGPAGPATYLEADYQEADMFLVPGNQGSQGSQGGTGAAGPAGPAVYLEADPQEPDWMPTPGGVGPTGATGAQGVQGPTGPAAHFTADDQSEDVLGTAMSNTNGNAQTLLNLTWTSPGNIGSINPSTGAFTTLLATGLITNTSGIVQSTTSGTLTIDANPTIADSTARIELCGTAAGTPKVINYRALTHYFTADLASSAYATLSSTGLFVSSGGIGTNAVIGAAPTFPTLFGNGGVEQARIDNAGNFGLGVTPSTWAAGRPAIELAGSVQSNIAFNGNHVNGGLIGSNYYDPSGPLLYKYSGIGFSGYNPGNGVHTWLIAGSGTAGNTIPYTTAMTLNSTGLSTAGTISPQQAPTASAPAYVKGAIYFDTTLNKLRVGGATAWETITSV